MFITIFIYFPNLLLVRFHPGLYFMHQKFKISQKYQIIVFWELNLMTERDRVFLLELISVRTCSQVGNSPVLGLFLGSLLLF